MKIDYIKVNGYGKLTNKEINLTDNINIIQGKNETGKSTLLNFINSMFYGAAKTKNGKNISVFDQYKPWKTEEFSGKIRYTLDNKESFEIYREFKKKSPVVYNNNLDDITNNFSIDKTKGIDFLNEQIGIDEDTFRNTVITSQNEIEINKSGQNAIIQKISNIISSGDENISFKKTLDKINKMQTEQVGTDRTAQKPINIVNNEIEELEEKKAKLEEYKIILENKSDNSEEIENNIKLEEKRLELLKCVSNNLQENKFKDTELDINKKIKEEYDNKINELNNKIDRRAKQSISSEKKSFKKYWITSFILLIISIINIFINIIKIIPIISILISIFIGILGYIKLKSFNRIKKDRISEVVELENKIKSEIEILENNKKARENEIELKREEIKKQKENLNYSIIQEFQKDLDINFIKMILEMNLDEVQVAISNKQERINTLKLDIQKKEIEKNQMLEKIGNLSTIQERLENAIQEKEELMSLNNSFNIAKECMELAYEEIRNSLNPVFIAELNCIISKISNSKYENIRFNDEVGLTVEIEDGRYLPVERLSIGTMDQMYLALRLSSINSITEENMPIILDESFVYFDDERLENIFKFINEKYSDKQIIIFTCSKREEDILKKLNINYSVNNL